MKHYYFKFWKGNKGLDKWKELGKSYENIDDEVYLSIYYGKWKVEEYETFLKSKHELGSKSLSQINTFFILNNDSEKKYFWIFKDEYIYAYESFDLKVFTPTSISGHENGLIDEYNSIPKSIKVKLFKRFNKIELPDFFACLNANQKYNRGTIEEFKKNSVEFRLVEALINETKIDKVIDKENFLEYLSPIEFETLMFLIFSRNRNYCSAFRGGTLKDFDLKVLINDAKVLELPSDINGKKIWIQLKNENLDNNIGKMKTLNKEASENEIYYIIHKGKRTEIKDKVLGKEWIIKQIDKSDEIKNWLKEMTFKYECLDFKWE